MNKKSLFSLLAAPLLTTLFAQSDTIVEMPGVKVDMPRIANQDPAGTFAMPISALRFDPRADVQARNLAEGQADVSIRGGIFENTGFKLGAVNLYDPRRGTTSQKFRLLPISSALLKY
jgi:vitamin B12 transporter